MNEDEAWVDAQRMHDIHERNKVSMAAWEAAGEFCTNDNLWRMTLRQAFEAGFMEGYKYAKG